MSIRSIQRIIRAVRTSDGAGVSLRRSLGQSDTARLDPFLMLDEFGSEDAADYIAGFPAHPHRGFETVTYMLEGHMLHEDHLGHKGHLKSGGVQWMSAARGIIHSEMPQQESGRMHGFQLWINLPSAEKMKEPAYRDIPGGEIPEVSFESGTAKVIAGTFETEGGERVDGAVRGISTEPVYFDLHLAPDARFAHRLPSDHHAFLYVYAGELLAAGADGYPRLSVGEAGLLSQGETVAVRTGSDGACALLLAARPLGEPVVQYGPFVMNTREEIEQAIRDYQAGTLARPAQRLRP